MNKNNNQQLIIKNSTIVCLFTYLLICVFPPAARSSSTSLSLSPPLIHIESIPPSNLETPITLTNKNDNNLAIQIIFQPFKASTLYNGQIEYLSNKNTVPHPDKEILKKIQITDKDKPLDEFELAPHQTKNLKLNINIPKKELHADYYYSIIFLASNIPQKKATSYTNKETHPQPQNFKEIQNISTTQSGIATNLILSIGSRTEAKAYIDEYSSPLFLESGPVPFTLKIKNTGNQVITPEGMILIRNIFGQTIGRVDIAPANVLANSKRYLIADPKNRPISLNDININEPKVIWPEKFLLGPYAATLEISMSDKGPTYKRSIYFLAAPAQAIITIILTLIISSLIYLRVLQNSKKTK